MTYMLQLLSYFKPRRNIKPSTSAGVKRDRRSARVFTARENDLSNDVLDASILSRPLATLASFLHTMSLLDQYANKSVTGICTIAHQVCIHKIHPHEKSCNCQIHPCGIPATFIPIPAGNPQISRNSEIPAIPTPVHTSFLEGQDASLWQILSKSVNLLRSYCPF